MWGLSLATVFLLASGHVAAQSIPQATLAREQYGHNEDYYEFERPIRRVAIIGAGISGLVAYRELTQAGFVVRLFERDDVPGGNWHYSEDIALDSPIPNADPVIADFVPSLPPDGVNLPYYQTYQNESICDELRRIHRGPTPVWESMSANEPSPWQHIPEFPWPKGTPWEISHWKVGRYLRSFAALHGANSNDDNPALEYNTRVENVEKRSNGGVWTLTLKKLERLDRTTSKVTWWTENFDAVLVATGRYNGPNIPNIPGLSEWHKLHPSSISHSRQYRRPDRFANRTVLIVGAASSGGEISRDISPAAKEVYQSIRPPRDVGADNRLNVINRLRIPRNTTIVGEIRRFLPLQHANGDGITGGEIELFNGTIISGIDHIIFATGFYYSYPFLPQFHNVSLSLQPEFKYPTRENPSTIVTDGTHLRSLHLDLFYIDDPTLGFICMNLMIGSFTLAGYEAAVFSKVWSRQARIPSRDKMWTDHRHRVEEAGGYSKMFNHWGSEKFAEKLRFFVSWLNDEALVFGGSQVELPPQRSHDILRAWSLSRAGYVLDVGGGYTPGSAVVAPFVDG